MQGLAIDRFPLVPHQDNREVPIREVYRFLVDRCEIRILFEFQQITSVSFLQTARGMTVRLEARSPFSFLKVSVQQMVWNELGYTDHRS